MILILEHGDLRADFKGDAKKPVLKDFPFFHGDPSILELINVVLYRYNDETTILQEPKYYE